MKEILKEWHQAVWTSHKIISTIDYTMQTKLYSKENLSF